MTDLVGNSFGKDTIVGAPKDDVFDRRFVEDWRLIISELVLAVPFHLADVVFRLLLLRLSVLLVPNDMDIRQIVRKFTSHLSFLLDSNLLLGNNL